MFALDEAPGHAVRPHGRLIPTSVTAEPAEEESVPHRPLVSHQLRPLDQDEMRARRGLRGDRGTEPSMNNVESTTHLQPQQSRHQSIHRRLRAMASRAPPLISENTVFDHAAQTTGFWTALNIAHGGRYLVGSIGDTYGENPYAANAGSNSTTSTTDHEVSNAVWIGLAVGATIVLLLIGGCVCWCCRESSKQRALEAEAMSRQSTLGRSQMSRAGSVRSVQSRDSNPRRRDYRNSMRASIVDEPQEIFRQSVRSFSQRFVRSDLQSDLDFDDEDTEDIYFKGVKCPRRPSGGRNALHDLYYGRPTLSKARSTKSHFVTQSLPPAKQDAVVLPGKKRSQSLIEPSVTRLASTPERPRRKSDFGTAEAVQKAENERRSDDPKSAPSDKNQNEPASAEPAPQPTESSDEINAQFTKTKRSDSVLSDTETTLELSGSIHLIDAGVPEPESKTANEHHHSHHHHSKTSKRKKTKKKDEKEKSESNDSSNPGDTATAKSCETTAKLEAALESSAIKPKKKKSSSKKKSKEKAMEGDRRPSRVDVL